MTGPGDGVPADAVVVAHERFATAVAEHGDTESAAHDLGRALGALEPATAAEVLDAVLTGYRSEQRAIWGGEPGGGAWVSVAVAPVAALVIEHFALLEMYLSLGASDWVMAIVQHHRAREYVVQGRFHDAERYVERVCLLAVERPELYGGGIHDSRALALDGLGLVRPAIDAFGEAYDLHVAAEDYQGAARTLDLAGGVLAAAGVYDEAAQAMWEASDMWLGLADHVRGLEDIDESDRADALTDLEAEALSSRQSAGFYMVADAGARLQEALTPDGAAEPRVVAEVRDLVARGRELGEGLVEVEGQGVSVLALAAMSVRDWAGAVTLLQEEPRTWDAVDDLEQRAYLWLVLTVSLVMSEQMATLDPTARKALNLARQAGLTTLEEWLLPILSGAAAARWDVDAMDVIGGELFSGLGGLMRAQLASWTGSGSPGGLGPDPADVEGPPGGPVNAHTVAMAPLASDASGLVTQMVANLSALADSGDTVAFGELLSRLDELTEALRVHGADLAAEWATHVGAIFRGFFDGDVPSTTTSLASLEALKAAVAIPQLQPTIDLMFAGAAPPDWSEPGDRVDLAVAAVIGLLAQARQLPSSAERRALRAPVDMHIDALMTLSAGRSTPLVIEDPVLVSELVEVLRSQALPDPVDPDAEVRSLASLMPERFGGGDAAAWQETELAVPARIRMPWGAVALERHLDQVAARYAPEFADAPTVDLVVPR